MKYSQGENSDDLFKEPCLIPNDFLKNVMKIFSWKEIKKENWIFS